MAPRRVVIDQPDGVRTLPKADACPACNASLDWVRKNDLGRVVLPCRCHRGHVTYEVRCRACAQLVLLGEASPGRELVLLPSQHDAIETVRARDREDAALDIERRGRDR